MKRIVRADWERAVLVCGKCSKKVGGGFGADGRTSLAKALRKLPGFGKNRRARIGVVEVKCLGVCPKRAVVAVDTADPRRWHLIPPGIEIEEIARTLLGDAVDPAPPVAVVEVTEILIGPDQPAGA